MSYFHPMTARHHGWPRALPSRIKWPWTLLTMVIGGGSGIGGVRVSDDNGGEQPVVGAGGPRANCSSVSVTPGLAYIMGEGPVEKKVFSATHRAVFFAGVGGTGHHLFQSVTQRCGAQRDCGSGRGGPSGADPVCDAVCRDAPFRPFLWQQKRRASGKHHGFWNSPPRFKQQTYCQLKQSMADSAETILKNAGRLRIDVINTMNGGNRTGMLSYPNLYAIGHCYVWHWRLAGRHGHTGYALYCCCINPLSRASHGRPRFDPGCLPAAGLPTATTSRTSGRLRKPVWWCCGLYQKCFVSELRGGTV